MRAFSPDHLAAARLYIPFHRLAAFLLRRARHTGTVSDRESDAIRAKFFEKSMHPFRLFHGEAADHDASGAGIKGASQLIALAKAAGDLQPQLRRTGEFSDQLVLHGPADASTVQVNDMRPFRARNGE